MAELSGSLVCKVARLHRGRLCEIELDHVTPRQDELERIEAAINILIGSSGTAPQMQEVGMA
jgi:hypothetical protein